MKTLLMKRISIFLFIAYFIVRIVAGQATGDIPLTNLQLDEATKFVLKKSDKVTALSIVDLSEYMPEVRNQGKLPSCSAWATGYYLRSYYQNIQNEGNRSEPFSPAYIYTLYTNLINKGKCTGFQTSAILDSILKNGIVPYQYMPYDWKAINNNCKLMPSNGLLKMSQSYSMTNFRTKVVLYMDEFKYLLGQQIPIVASIKVDDNFKTLDKSNSIQTQFNERYFSHPSNRNNHAVVVVGYNESKEAFKIINSWGKEWGDEGYGWISFNIFSAVFNAGYVAIDYSDLTGGEITIPKPESSIRSTFQPGDSVFSSWFKEGYFRDYDEFNTRLLLKEFNRKEKLALIELRDLKTQAKIKDVYLELGETNEFKVKNEAFSVSISFDKVANAGRNPLKKAVYYELSFKDLEHLELNNE